MSSRLAALAFYSSYCLLENFAKMKYKPMEALDDQSIRSKKIWENHRQSEDSGILLWLVHDHHFSLDIEGHKKL
jgi:hypothetical protein